MSEPLPDALEPIQLERDIARLHAYHDGELGALARWRFERALRRSPALRAELDALRAVSRAVAAVAADERVASPAPERPLDVWAGLAPALAAADAERARAPRRPAFDLGIPRWALGSGALAAAALVAIVLVVRGGTAPGDGGPATAALGAPATGVVRYLDSGGRPVMVIEDPDDDVTIIWTFDAA